MLVEPLQLDLRDRLAVDLVRPVGESERARAGPGLGERKVLRDAAPAVRLNRPVDDAERHIRRDDFDHGDGGSSLLVAVDVHGVGGVQRQQARLIDLDAALGDVLSNRPLLGQRRTERHALLRAATEIASGLDAAHRAGITHRDLKPSNVMLTRGGVKLLDFGVARHRPIPDGSDPDQITTVLATVEGALVGTVPYMAPEQLGGRAIDGRTDIFAFGAVLFEMATAQRAFAGTSAAGLAAAILGESRPRLPESAGLPPALGRLISTCLARDPDERWQHAGDLRHALKWIGEDAGAVRTAAGVASPRRAPGATLPAAPAVRCPTNGARN